MEQRSKMHLKENISWEPECLAALWLQLHLGKNREETKHAPLYKNSFTTTKKRALVTLGMLLLPELGFLQLLKHLWLWSKFE